MQNKQCTVVYSLNQIAYLMLLGFEPKFKSDNDILWYAVFDKTDELDKAVVNWRNEKLQLPIHDFLNEYKNLRKTLNGLRGE